MKVAVLVLGTIGAVFGLMGAVLAIGLGGLGTAFGSQDVASVSNNGVVALLTSITGLVGAILVFKNTKLAGWFMVGSAIIGFVAAFLAYIIAAIFFFIAGILALTMKQAVKKVNKETNIISP